MSSSGRGGQVLTPNGLQDGSYEFNGRREPGHRNAIHGLVRAGIQAEADAAKAASALIADRL
jgi:hypothetical protein